MNLSEFVDETLTKILSGVRAAQKKEGGQEIAAEMFSADGKAMGVIAAGTSGLNEKKIADFTRVVEQTGILEREPQVGPI
jgi:hypothetical protein